MKKVVYDLETLRGLFSYTGKDVDTGEIYVFVLHEKRFELDEFVKHLKTVTHMIGFNNISFDYPILHHILLSYKDWSQGLSEFGTLTYDDVIESIYQRAQVLIQQQNNTVFGGSFSIKSSEIIIAQLDLYKMWHFNNAARATGLKALQISMNYSNVEDMSIDHKQKNISLDEIDNILSYNLNDVLSTEAFYKLSEDKIQLRKDLQKKYGLNCMNFPDSKIGESLILKLYCEKTGQNLWDVKQMRTERPSIALKDCIPDYIRFKTKEFQSLLSFFQSKVITETKGAIEESVVFKGFKYDYGTGGLHGCIKPGVYVESDTYQIIDADVAGMYPSIAIANDLFPEHLGPVFCEVYKKEIIDPRMIAKKEGNMMISNALKLAGNATYGKSNDKHSFLYDPIYTLKTTLIGQLTLSMLCEKLVMSCDLTILQVNTKLKHWCFKTPLIAGIS